MQHGEGSELSPRQEQILLAIVKEYTRTGAPVPSKTVHEQYAVAASKATIRNEMAEMERLGYLTKPHTSGGRIPLEKAYRLYVDRMGEVSGTLQREMAWVRGELERGGSDLASLLRTSTRVLSELTEQPALASEPAATSAQFLQFRLRPVSAWAVRVTYLTTEGGERETLWEPPVPLRGEQIQRLSEKTETALQQQEHEAIRAHELAMQAEVAPEAAESLLQVLAESRGERVYVEGAMRLLGFPELRAEQRLQDLLTALGQEAAARALLSSVVSREGLSVLIGSEHGRSRFQDCSLVAETYTVARSGRGAIGVLGPLRMSYVRAMSAVNCVARAMVRTLRESADPEEEE